MEVENRVAGLRGEQWGGWEGRRYPTSGLSQACGQGVPVTGQAVPHPLSVASFYPQPLTSVTPAPPCLLRRGEGLDLTQLYSQGSLSIWKNPEAPISQEYTTYGHFDAGTLSFLTFFFFFTK